MLKKSTRKAYEKHKKSPINNSQNHIKTIITATTIFGSFKVAFGPPKAHQSLPKAH
jgi:hypothetical protein